jgi:phosphopantetheinyl transferase (holo-ACP synthase)
VQVTTQRLAGIAAVADLFRLLDGPPEEALPDPLLGPNRLYFFRHRLGGPKVRWRGSLARWAWERGLAARDLHVSFSHDGEVVVGLAACAPGLRGLGVDLVHLPRLRRPGKDAAYLHRFARHFMAPDEYAAFQAAAAGDDLERLRCRVAAHFSLMEAASKALGTGLKMGGGLGRPTSLPKRSLNVVDLGDDEAGEPYGRVGVWACGRPTTPTRPHAHTPTRPHVPETPPLPPVRFSLASEALARCRALCGRGPEPHLEGYWSAGAEFLASVVLLHEP